MFNFMNFLAAGNAADKLTVDMIDFSIGTIFAAFGWAAAVRDTAVAKRFLIGSTIMIFLLLLGNVFLTWALWLTRTETVFLLDGLALVALAIVIWKTTSRPEGEQ